jgi:hypothetical protein
MQMSEKNNAAIHELERAIKYREREIASFQSKLLLMQEQMEQYQQELIPKYEQEIEVIRDAIEQIKLADLVADDDLPF